MIWPVEQTVVGDVIGDSHAISCHLVPSRAMNYTKRRKALS